MKKRQDFVLRFRLQIDEEIAAANEINVGEGRVSQYIVNREDDAVAQFMGDLVAVLISGEELRQPVWRDIRLDRIGIEPVARESHGVPVDVRGEDLKPRRPFQLLEGLQEQHGYGIGLFTCAAARTPYANRTFVFLVVDEIGDDFFGQELESRFAAEKLRDADQQILAKQLGLSRLLTQKL